MVLIIIIVSQNDSELIKIDYNQEEKPLHKKKKRLMKQRSQTDFHLHSVSSKNPSVCQSYRSASLSRCIYIFGNNHF